MSISISSRLPKVFVERMHEIFTDNGMAKSFPNFLESFDEIPRRGLRFNLSKIISLNEISQILSQVDSDIDSVESNKKIEWSDDGYYISQSSTPGKHPFYSAGIYYIQEPSAMLPARLLNAQSNERILDLCAAPGGKTVKISSDMKNRGILISNDINHDRAKALLRNTQLHGCTNCIATNETPEKLANYFIEYFDKILVDAPCSGEGMFRRDANSIKSWESFGSESCTVMQQEILESAAKMLKPGGSLVYSTCTFSLEENEKMITDFLLKHNEFSPVNIFDNGSFLAEIEKRSGILRGLVDGNIRNCMCRIMPHLSEGDGHFCAVIAKIDDQEKPLGVQGVMPNKVDKHNKNKAAQLDQQIFSTSELFTAFDEFADNNLVTEAASRIKEYFTHHLNIYSGHVYTFNTELQIPDRINIIKKGFHIGNIKRVKSSAAFEPSHQLLMALKSSEIKNVLNLKAENKTVDKYLRCETLFLSDFEYPGDLIPGSYAAVCVESYPLGWIKAEQGGMLKNLYPKGWRKQ